MTVAETPRGQARQVPVIAAAWAVRAIHWRPAAETRDFFAGLLGFGRAMDLGSRGSRADQTVTRPDAS